MQGSTLVAPPRPVADISDTTPGQRLRTGGWFCAVVLALTTAALLHWYGVSVRDIAAFGTYSLAGVAVPGLLLWRALLGRPGHIATDLAAGCALGYAVEIPAYVLCRSIGAPLAVVAWPALTLAAFTVVPRLRSHWRGSGERMPVGPVLAFAVLWLYFLAMSASSVFRIEGLSGHAATAPYIDVPWHLALTGELKHHFPAQMPYIAGEPLQYHWYVYAHIASASWITGIEPQVLILRLVPLPAMAAFGVLVVAIGRVLTRRWWPGLAAIGLSCVGVVTDPFGWNVSLLGLSPFDYAWLSPTEAFAGTIFAALALVLVGILRGTYGRRRAPWIALFVLVGAVAGAKATYLPLLICGAAAVIVVQMILTRRPGPAVWVIGIVAVWLSFAQFVLFGGGTEGMVVAPLITAKRTSFGIAAFGPPTPVNHYAEMLAICLLVVALWAFACAGGIGLLTREARRDTSNWLVAGIGVAGVGALFAFGHPDASQFYFLVSSRPYLSLAAVSGLAALMDLGRERSVYRNRARVMLWVLAAALGAGAAYAVSETVGLHRPTGAHVIAKFGLPFAALLGVLAICGVGLVAAAWIRGLGRRSAVAAVALMLTMTVTPPVVSHLWAYANMVHDDHLRNQMGGRQSIATGGIPAMRWLRDHSSPDDLVATNEHCRILPNATCDARDFWISGYSERRVLIEGWAYTERALEAASPYDGGAGGKFWDPALLAANDAVFYTPTETDVRILSTAYRVRWLVAVGTVDPALGRYATLRYQTAGVAIYEIDRP